MKPLEITVAASPRKRAVSFIRAYQHAAPGDDIAFRVGTGIVGIQIGRSHYGLTAQEARMVADIFEDSIKKFPNEPECASFPNLIMALRHAAEKSEQH